MIWAGRSIVAAAVLAGTFAHAPVLVAAGGAQAGLGGAGFAGWHGYGAGWTDADGAGRGVLMWTAFEAAGELGMWGRAEPAPAAIALPARRGGEATAERPYEPLRLGVVLEDDGRYDVPEVPRPTAPPLRGPMFPGVGMRFDMLMPGVGFWDAAGRADRRPDAGRATADAAVGELRLSF